MIRRVEEGESSGGQARGAPVHVLIVHPRDPAAPTLGGIQTFLRDFIKYAPADFDISFVGTTRDAHARPVGRWMSLDVDGRRIRFLAVATNSGISRSPAALYRSMKGLARLWRALGAPHRILQVHRPYRSFVLDRHRGPTVQFIHLDLRDWPGPQGWPKLRGLYREFSDETLERMDHVFIVNEAGALMLRHDHPRSPSASSSCPCGTTQTSFTPLPTRSATACDASSLTLSASRAKTRRRCGSCSSPAA